MQSGADVNTKDEMSWTRLMWAVRNNCNAVVAFLLKTPNIDVNLKNDIGGSALDLAVRKNNEALKLLLDVPGIDVNVVNNEGKSALHWAVFVNNIEALTLLLSHPGITALTLNQKDKDYGFTPVAVVKDRLEHLAELVADLRVDLDTTDKEGRTLEEVARCAFLASDSLASPML